MNREIVRCPDCHTDMSVPFEDGACSFQARCGKCKALVIFWRPIDVLAEQGQIAKQEHQKDE
ncbi:MAG: hypothetical protein JSU86_07830 [Phycisphaerales bacterium]|nr:MAG: hypothetical protein JSU86_07830 [Phycisphaerales bacterium]